ncbi:phasin family protein [Novosphingobium taihuense]|uniref:Phasin family protein n=1 Tax=Novosphingobium taihuense TaxID=260085 RepID=A0A7W7A9G8_9SPHN|nr:phasin family protein [Novosphingobium taihuense]MBB4612791.1 phasin family protein [Novosphingobium taihuense]TWH80298.1 phasin family protein [Novosphingobium taihuense]
MVEETKDSLVESAPVVDAPAALPDVTEATPETAPETAVADTVEASVVEQPKAASPRKPRTPKVKARKAKAVEVATTEAEAPAETPAAEPVAEAVDVPAAKAVTPKARKPRVVKVKPVKQAAKPAIKARPAKPPVAVAPAAAVKPAAKRPFTATPSVKKTSASQFKAPAPRKELFAMATTTTEITEKMTAAFKEAQEKAKAALEKSQAAFGDAGAFAKGNVEAVVESSKIFASGLQEMTKGYVEETKSAFEAMTADVKDLTTVKSPTEFFEKQSALLRKNFDAAVAASSKNSEAMLKLANEAFQPISTRVSLAVEKIKHAA